MMMMMMMMMVVVMVTTATMMTTTATADDDDDDVDVSLKKDYQTEKSTFFVASGRDETLLKFQI